MKTITCTEFRKRASGLLTQVEHGASYVIIRHGRPIAELTPYAGASQRKPAWKRPRIKLENEEISLSALILKERESCE